MNEEETESKKTSGKKIAAYIIAVAVIGAAISIFVEYRLEEQKKIDMYNESFKRAMDYQMDATVKACVAHDNYTGNTVATSLFRNITTVYPFLVAQSKILFTDIDTMVDNVTMPNYYTALKQYFLCAIINSAYMQNYTKYFNMTFPGMNYVYFNDVAYQDDEPPQSTISIGSDGYWVRYYSTTLEDANLKLDYISGVLAVVYTGGNQ